MCHPLLFLLFPSVLLAMSVAPTPKGSLPRLVALDLDGTIWQPEMYQLSDGPPFTYLSSSEAKTNYGSVVKLIGDTANIIDFLYENKIILAWVSCTDEPDWADELLNNFKTAKGVLLSTACGSSQIFKANKQEHFRRLKKQFPDIEYNEMVFFDNEHHNVASVEKLGVHSVYCPRGLTKDIWADALAKYSQNRSR